MFVRLTSIYCEDNRIDDAIACLEEVDRPAVEAAAGNRGLRTVVDRRSAVLVAASYWDVPEQASEATLTQARWAATEAAAGELTTETWEVAARMHAHPHPGGTVLQMYCAPHAADVADLGTVVADSVFRPLSTCPGIRQAELLLDPTTGAAFLTTEWADEAQLRQFGMQETARLLGHLRDQLDFAFAATGNYAVIRSSLVLQ